MTSSLTTNSTGGATLVDSDETTDVTTLTRQTPTRHKATPTNDLDTHSSGIQDEGNMSLELVNMTCDASIDNLPSDSESISWA